MKYLPFFLLLAGCSEVTDLLDAVDELAISATTGAEEALLGGTMSPAAIPAEERPDPFRACDASGGFEELFARYDADSDGALDVPEEDEVHAARADRSVEQDRMVRGQWALLVAVYDTDGDGVIGESERAVLLDDFTVRCEAVQALLLEEFDTDGDGALSEDEQHAARDAIEEEVGHHGEGGGDCPRHEGEDSGASQEGPGRAPPEGAPPEESLTGAPAVPPPLMDEFDADGDGALSDSERATLQATMRERIRAGEKLRGL